MIKGSLKAQYKRSSIIVRFWKSLSKQFYGTYSRTSPSSFLLLLRLLLLLFLLLFFFFFCFLYTLIFIFTRKRKFSSSSYYYFLPFFVFSYYCLINFAEFILNRNNNVSIFDIHSHIEIRSLFFTFEFTVYQTWTWRRSVLDRISFAIRQRSRWFPTIFSPR